MNNKNILVLTALSVVGFSGNSAQAVIYPVEEYSGFELSGNGSTPEPPSPPPSSSCNYTWTSDNCPSPKVLLGDSCTKDGVRYYQLCGCNPNWIDCQQSDSRKVGIGDGCANEGENTKFASCRCADIFEYTSVANPQCSLGRCTYCSGELSGTSCTDDADNIQKWTECINQTSCDYTWTIDNCQSPKTLSGNRCTRDEVVYRENCVCGSSFQVCANGQIGAGPTCTDSGVTKYKFCLDCSADDYVYKLNDSTNGKYWYNVTDYPAFVCSSSNNANIYKYCYNGECLDRSSTDADGVRYDKVGYMLSNVVGVELTNQGYFSPWLSGDNQHIFVGHLDDVPSNFNYAPSWIYGRGISASGIISLLHGLSPAVDNNGVSGTGTTADDPKGPRNTYNYTFGVPYYDYNAQQIVDDSGQPASTFSHIGDVANIVGSGVEYHGVIVPAWYCMTKNLNIATLVASSDGTWLPTDNNIADDKTFTFNNYSANNVNSNSENNGVYYYLPTTADIELLRGSSGYNTILQNTFGTSSPTVNLWTSTLDNNGVSPQAYTTYLGSNANSWSAVDISFNNSFSIPIMSWCFIYVGGYIPESCEISYNQNGNYLTTGCHVQQQ